MPDIQQPQSPLDTASACEANLASVRQKLILCQNPPAWQIVLLTVLTMVLIFTIYKVMFGKKIKGTWLQGDGMHVQFTHSLMGSVKMKQPEKAIQEGALQGLALIFPKRQGIYNPVTGNITWSSGEVWSKVLDTK
jgi:hypothetical protein